MAQLSEEMLYYSKLTSGTTTVALSSGASNVNSTAIAAGIYQITSDIDCFVKQGAAAVAAAAATSPPLWAKVYCRIHVDATANGFFGGIAADSGATGTLYIIPVRT